ncbi:uncharacterized protein [Linepithema humile]|uniref:uncharacterized protein n=1 Tax=Linepithema humile TaxID=83485 RepID=UPI00351F1D6E
MFVLHNLPIELLEIIFNFCDIPTLSKISMVCKQFSILAFEIFAKKSDYLLVTNQKSKEFSERCKPLLPSYKFKFTIHYNWINGRCKKNKIYRIEQRAFKKHVSTNKCILMTKNTVWFCEDSNLLAFNRAENGTIKMNKKIVGTNNSFIKSIAHCDDYIISGDVYGIIKHWKIESKKNKRFEIKQSKIHNINHQIDLINATSQHIIISYNNSIKILKYTDDKQSCTEEKEIFCGDKSYAHSYSYQFHAQSFDPIGTKFAASSINCGQNTSSFVIYDIDKRTSEFVRKWGSSIYAPFCCCSSDNLYTFVTGGSAGVLWDQRQSVAIKAYNVEHDKDICSLEFDNAHIYAAVYNGLYELDFTGRNHFLTTKK